MLGTAGTIKSGAYDDEIHVISPDATVFPLACPEFVPIVESGQYKSENASVIVERTLRELDGKDFDAAILGCTHYPLLEHHIKKHLPDHVKIISSAVETVRDVERIYLLNGIEHDSERKCCTCFLYNRMNRTTFRAIVTDWLSY